MTEHVDHPPRGQGPPARVSNRTMPECTIIPELVYDDVIEALEWLCHTFGLVERWRAGDHRAQLSFGACTIAITEPRTGQALPGRHSLLVRVPDADAHCERARPLVPAALISVMLIVPDAEAAVAWYREALGATVLWDLGGVAGLRVGGSAFFVHETNPDNPAEDSPQQVGVTSTRIEVFTDDPEAFRAGAIAAGARAGSEIVAHQVPWGTHRQGGFHDPFGHNWSVGDRSPLGPLGGGG